MTQRITPAGAGKTRLKSIRLNRNGDHPRRCGENRNHARYTQRAGRITPAGAGKTCCPHQLSGSPWDHPRRCGENANFPLIQPGKKGSPPQVRGKPFPVSLSVQSARITPAGAGKTRTKRTYRPDMTDHPRRCGENFSPRLPMTRS